MRSQAPLAPYVGLWTRLQVFAPEELTALTDQRQVARLNLMRNTVHLVSARDCLDWRALFYPLHTAEFSAHLRHGIKGVDRDALLTQAKRLLAEQPRTRGELGKLLAERWPDADPSALAYAATHHIALCQVPPRGIWGKNGPAAWAPVESWLGAPLRPVPVDALVLRYLGAFGPARVADIQLWSGWIAVNHDPLDNDHPHNAAMRYVGTLSACGLNRGAREVGPRLDVGRPARPSWCWRCRCGC